jgi:isopenicillin N synthase-like dioxygenase
MKSDIIKYLMNDLEQHIIDYEADELVIENICKEAKQDFEQTNEETLLYWLENGILSSGYWQTFIKPQLRWRA